MYAGHNDGRQQHKTPILYFYFYAHLRCLGPKKYQTFNQKNDYVLPRINLARINLFIIRAVLSYLANKLID